MRLAFFRSQAGDQGIESPAWIITFYLSGPFIPSYIGRSPLESRRDNAGEAR